MPRFWLINLVLVLGLAPSAAAQQQECFTVAGESARAQHVVGLHTAVRLSPGCEYATTPAGPWNAPGALAGRDTDFLEIFQNAGTATADPRLVLGRRPAARRGQEPVVNTLLLRYCAHYLLEEQLGFRVTPQPGGGGFRVDRVSGEGSCDGARVELRAVRGAREERLFGGPAEQTLGTSQSSLTLGQGDWSLYAARPGGALGLRIGVFRSQRVVTPLANHLRSVGLEHRETTDVPPLLAARWDVGSPGLLLHPSEAALGQELLWPEMRTAADAGLLWLANVPEQGDPTVISSVEIVSGEPPSVRLPDPVVRDYMRARYREAGSSLAPSLEDWQGIFEHLAVCLTPSYNDARRIENGAAVPDAGACASLRGLTILAQAADAAGRFCVRRGMQVITSDGVRHQPGDPECFPLPPPGSDERPPYRMMVAGDRISVEGDGLCTLLDNAPIAPGADGEIVLERSGLFEVRQAGGEGCASAQAISRLRLPVVDPQHDWHPVGLYTTTASERLTCGGDDTRMCPWRVLEHDESDHFVFVKPRHELEFRMSTSPQVAAALNGDPRTRGIQVTEDVPLLSGINGSFEGAGESAIVAYVTRDPACPSAETTYAQLRSQPPIDVDDLGPDAEFHVILLSVEAEERPVACLARASFRVRPSRVVAALTVGDFAGFELGLLGDTQFVFFGNTPLAVGFALPLVWFRVALGQRYVVLEVAGNAVLGVAVEPVTYAGAGGVPPDGTWPALTRLGASLSWSASFGVPEWNIPRLLSVGGMLHGAAETHPFENPIVSFYVGLNLSSLIDLAGGR